MNITQEGEDYKRLQEWFKKLIEGPKIEGLGKPLIYGTSGEIESSKKKFENMWYGKN